MNNKLYSPLDLDGQPLINGCLERLPADPADNNPSRIYHNTTTDTVRIKYTSGWDELNVAGANRTLETTITAGPGAYAFAVPAVTSATMPAATGAGDRFVVGISGLDSDPGPFTLTAAPGETINGQTSITYTDNALVTLMDVGNGEWVMAGTAEDPDLKVDLADKTPTLRDAASADDTRFPTEKAVVDALDLKVDADDVVATLRDSASAEDDKIASEKSVALGLDSKVDLADLTTSVRDAASAEDTKFPSEKSVATALDTKQDSSDRVVMVRDVANAESDKYPSESGVAIALAGKEDSSNKATSIRPVATADNTKYTSEKAVSTGLADKVETGDVVQTVRADGATEAGKIPSESAVRAAISGVAGVSGAHAGDTNNPHSVTKAQVGLENVENTSDASKPISTLAQSALTPLQTHAGSTSNPHGVDKDDVGLANVDNTTDMAKPISTLTQGALTPLQTHEASTSNPHGVDKDDVGLANVDNTTDMAKPISTLTQDALTPLQTLAASTSNPHGVTKAQVDLANVDNTADSAKPVSTLQQAAIDLVDDRFDDYQEAGEIVTTITDSASASDTKYPSEKAVASAIEGIESDVLYFANMAAFPTTGEADTIYVDKANNLAHRWDSVASNYPALSETLAIGTAIGEAGDGAILDALATTVSNQGASSEDTANKSTILRDSASADDVKFPTEKAVATALDAKVDTANQATTIRDSATADDVKFPSEKAVATALDTKQDTADLVTSIRGTGVAEDSKYPSENAVRLAISGIAGGLGTHGGDVSNPHSVTKAQVGLTDADDTSDANKPVSTATQDALDLKVDKVTNDIFKARVDNPHSVTKAQVDLGSVDNTSDASKPISGATQTALDGKASKSAYDTFVARTDNPHSVDKGDVGLGNVDNTADMAKPISTLTGTALAGKASKSDYDTFVARTDNPHGVTAADVGLGNVGNTLPADLPISDDTQDALDLKVDKVTNDIFKARVDNPHSVTKAQVDLANVDNTSDADKPLSDDTITALAGKASKTDYDTFVARTDNPHQVDKGDVGLGNVDDTSDMSKPISTLTQNALTPLQTLAASTSNPHSVTKAQVSLGNVDNTSDMDKPISDDVSDEFDLVDSAIAAKASKADLLTTPRDVASAEDTKFLSEKAIVTALDAKTDNADKVTTLRDSATAEDSKFPSEKAVALGLDGKQDVSDKVTLLRSSATAEDTKYPSEKAVANAIDGIGGGVVEANVLANLPSTGEAGVLYSTTDDNKVHRWDTATTAYVELSETLTIGTGAGEAGDGAILAGKQDADGLLTSIRASGSAEDTKFVSEKAVATALESKVASGDLRTSVRDTATSVDTETVSEKAIATSLDTKQDTADLVTTVRDVATAEDTKYPSEKSVASFVDASIEAAPSSGEYADMASLPVSGDEGKLYLTKDDGAMYRWDDATSAYVPVGSVSGLGYKGTGADDGEGVYKVTGPNYTLPTATGSGDRRILALDPASNTVIGVASGSSLNGVVDDTVTIDNPTVVTAIDTGTGEWTIEVPVTRESLNIDHVDNTSDVNKPISTLTQNAIDAVESSVTVPTYAELPVSGAHGAIYIVSATNVTYRWDTATSTYFEIGGNSGGGTVPAMGNNVPISDQGTYTSSGQATIALPAASGVGESRVISVAPTGTTTITVPSGEYLNGVLDGTMVIGEDSVITVVDNGAGKWTVGGNSDATSLGIDNVDNTSDADKPISTATQNAIDAIDTPMFSADLASFPSTGDDGVIYVANDTGDIYRWDTATTDYVMISKAMIIGTTAGTVADGEVVANLGTDKEDIANRLTAIRDSASAEDTKYASEKAIITSINSSISTAFTNDTSKLASDDLTTTVRDAATAEDDKIPSEKSVATKIDSSISAAFTADTSKMSTSDVVTSVRDAASAEDDKYPSEKAVASKIDSVIAADTSKVNTSDVVTTIRDLATAEDTKVPSEKSVATSIDSEISAAFAADTSKVSTSDTTTTVRDHALAEDAKFPSEKAVASKIDSSISAAFTADTSKQDSSDRVTTIRDVATAEDTKYPSEKAVASEIVSAFASDTSKLDSDDLTTTVRDVASAEDDKIPSEKSVATKIDSSISAAFTADTSKQDASALTTTVRAVASAEDTKYPSEKAVASKIAADFAADTSKMNSSDVVTSVRDVATAEDTKYPTEKAVASEIDSSIASAFAADTSKQDASGLTLTVRGTGTAEDTKYPSEKAVAAAIAGAGAIPNVEYHTNEAAFPVAGSDEVIYVDKATSTSHYWDGNVSSYKILNESLVIGTTAGTAGDGADLDALSTTVANQGTDKEDAANKTTSVRSVATANDTKFPTELAVSVSVNAKQNKDALVTSVRSVGSSEDTKFPSEKAVASGLVGKQDTSNLVTTVRDSATAEDTKYTSEKAVVEKIDSSISSAFTNDTSKQDSADLVTTVRDTASAEDSKYPSEKAVSSKIDSSISSAFTNDTSKQDASGLTTTVREVASAEDTKYPSEKAVASEIDSSISTAFTNDTSKLDSSDLTTTVRDAVSAEDTKIPSEKSVATKIDSSISSAFASDTSKLDSSDLTTTVRDAATAEDDKIPSEKSVATKIDSSIASAFASDTSKQDASALVTTVRDAGSAEDTKYPSEKSVASKIDSSISAAFTADTSKQDSADRVITVRDIATAEDSKYPSEKAVAAAIVSGGGGGTIQVADFASLPGTGDPAMLYVTKDTEHTYRWDTTGSSYEEVGTTPGVEFKGTNPAYTGEGTYVINSQSDHMLPTATGTGHRVFLAITPLTSTTLRVPAGHYLNGVLNDTLTVTREATVVCIDALSGKWTITGYENKHTIGLGNCDNTTDANKPISTATQNALDAIDTSHHSATNNPHGVTKAQVLLGNVDNTTDLLKPISTATQDALDNLDLDSTIEAANFAGLPSTGAVNKLYITKDDNKTFRWDTGTTAYVEVGTEPGLVRITGLNQPMVDAGVYILNATSAYTLKTAAGQGDRYYLSIFLNAGQSCTISVPSGNRLNSVADGTLTVTKDSILTCIDSFSGWWNVSGSEEADALGLDQVDNTSDLDKPISDLTQDAIDALDVDSVEQAGTFAAFPSTGTVGKLYISTNNNKTYRWNTGTSTYLEVGTKPGLSRQGSNIPHADEGVYILNGITTYELKDATGSGDRHFLAQWLNPGTTLTISVPTGNYLNGVINGTYVVDSDSVLTCVDAFNNYWNISGKNSSGGGGTSTTLGGVSFFSSGTMPNNSWLAYTILEEDLVLTANVPQSKGNVGFNPTGSITLTVAKDISGTFTDIGSVNISAAGAVTWTGFSAQTLMAGTGLRIKSPSDCKGVTDVYVTVAGVMDIPT